MFTLDGDGRLYSGDGQGGDEHGDKSFRDTVDSLPSGYRMCAYAGFTLVKFNFVYEWVILTVTNKPSQHHIIWGG